MRDYQALCRGTPRASPTYEVDIVREPPPPLIEADNDYLKLLRASWFWIGRNVVGDRVAPDDRRIFFVTKDELRDSAALFREKLIAPGAWMYFLSRAKRWRRMPSMAGAIGLDWLMEPGRRGWFRQSTTNLFGGRVALTPTQELIVERQRRGAKVSSIHQAAARLEVAALRREHAHQIALGALFFNGEDIKTWSPKGA